METIGWVGAGALGNALLERLRLSGAAVRVYDPDVGAGQRAAALGAAVVASAAEAAAGAGVIDVVVQTDEQAEASIAGARGVLEAAPEGALVLLHSTVHPNTTRRLAAEAGRRGVTLLDACVVARPPVARSGAAVFLVGGPDDAVARARGHLLCMGRLVLHMGPLGAGNAAKIAKNLVTGSTRLIVREALQIAEAAGIPGGTALDMILEASGRNTLRGVVEEAFDRETAHPTLVPSDVLFGKDLPLAGRLASEQGLDVPITAALAASADRVHALSRAAGPDL